MPPPALAPDFDKRLHAALLDCFNRSELKELVGLELGYQLDTEVEDGPFRAVVFELIGWAKRHGRLPALLTAAAANRQAKPVLAELRDELAATATPPAGGRLRAAVVARWRTAVVAAAGLAVAAGYFAWPRSAPPPPDAVSTAAALRTAFDQAHKASLDATGPGVPNRRLKAAMFLAARAAGDKPSLLLPAGEQLAAEGFFANRQYPDAADDLRLLAIDLRELLADRLDWLETQVRPAARGTAVPLPPRYAIALGRTPAELTEPAGGSADTERQIARLRAGLASFPAPTPP